MKKQQGQSVVYGMIILTAGTLVVKVIGALFKIPLTNILGALGMTYFNVGYDLYYPLYALFVSGVPVAVSKLVSESVAKGKVGDARRLLRVSLLLFFGVGLLGSCLMLLGARWFSGLLPTPEAVYSIWMLSPALFFGCIMAAYRGYFQGLQNMIPTALSQIIESIAKLVFGLSISHFVIKTGMEQYLANGTVFGVICETPEQAQLAILPFAAAGAILGVSISALCGAVFLAIRYYAGAKRDLPKLALYNSAPKTPRRTLAKNLVLIAVPVCIASLISNLTSLIDLLSVMNRLEQAAIEAPDIILGMYEGLIPPHIASQTDKLVGHLYGCYSGLAVPVYNLVPALTGAIGVSLLPAVSAAWATHNKQSLADNIGSALRLASMVSMPIGIGIFVLAQPIMQLLFFNKQADVILIAPALRLMGISAVFVALSLPANAILQATGKASLPVKLMILGGGVKLVLNYLLVSIPQLNIQAAPVGTLVCYIVVLSVSIWKIIRHTKIKIPLMKVFGKPLFCSICCGASAWVSYGLLGKVLEPRFATLTSVSIAGVIYLVFVLLTKTLTKIDLFMVPGAEKFVNTLAKRGLLG